MVSSSPSATNTDFPSLETAIPRGRCPVGIVATVSILSVSTTEMELPFSFETKARKAEAGSAPSSKSATQRLPNAVLAIADIEGSPEGDGSLLPPLREKVAAKPTDEGSRSSYDLSPQPSPARA